MTARLTRWLTSLRLVLVTLLTAFGFLLGKDPERAGEELRGLGRWLGGRHEALAANPAPAWKPHE